MDDHHLRRQRGEGIAAAGQIAGDKGVAIASASASIAAQALDLGLGGEVTISLVPVLLGDGNPLLRQPGPCTAPVR